MTAGPLHSRGIEALDGLRWGAHVCHFFETRQDLIDTLVPYFRTGLERNEKCLWVTTEPFWAEDARAVLRATLPDFEAREARGQIEIVDHHAWYVASSGFRAEEVLDGWLRHLSAARASGFEGVRVSGNLAWLEAQDWDGFTAYEAEVTRLFRGRRLMAICSYCAGRCTSDHVLDVVRNHERALVRRQEGWDLIESLPLSLAREELGRREALEESLAQQVAELEEGLAARDEFLDAATQALEAPFASLRQKLDALAREDGRGLPAAQAALWDEARAQLEKLDRGLLHLRDVTRKDPRRMPLHLAPVDAVEVARVVAERMADDLARAGCDLALRADEAVVGLWDRARLEELYEHLLSNAMRHAPGKPIEIDVSVGRNRALISVRDQGPGIAPAAQRRIFERFVRLAPEPRGGHGLGLFRVRQIAQALGGSAQVASMPGKGATFMVSLPRNRSGAGKPSIA